MTIIEKLLNDFGGNWNVDAVLKRIGNAQRQRCKSFLKVAKKNGLVLQGKLGILQR